MLRPAPPKQADLDQLIEILRSTTAPRRIYLFGSLITGGYTQHSDIDVLLVLDDEANCLLAGMAVQDALFRARFPFPVDVVPVPESDLKKYGHIGGLIYREALSKGEVIYDAASAA